jgi:hypothetical protein
MGPNAVAFDNHFPNANRTAASTSLILTGKYAITTRKYNSARFFSGRDAYEHLPGVLRAHGYRAIQIGAGHHVDSFYWGMRLAFDEHNGKAGDTSPLDRLSDRLGGRLNWELRFPLLMFERVEARVRHAFGGPLMEQPHLAARKKSRNIDGQRMIDQLTAFLQANPGPVFAQLHSMSARDPKRGLGRFDAMVSKIIAVLDRQGRFEDALIVIWSDHGRRYATHRRLPLIVKFPRKVDVPSFSANTQTLDIAPTVLDVLGLPIPDWMEGRSLLHPLDPYEPIFITESEGLKRGLEPDTLGETVEGGLGGVSLIVCDGWSSLNLLSDKLRRRKIDGHTAPCPAGRRPDKAEARAMIVRHLDVHGYRSAYEALLVQ